MILDFWRKVSNNRAVKQQRRHPGTVLSCHLSHGFTQCLFRRHIPWSHSGPGLVPPYLPHREAGWAQRPGLRVRGGLAPPEALHPLLPHQLNGCGPRLPDAGYYLRGALQRPAVLCQVQRALAQARSEPTGLSVPYWGFQSGPLLVLRASPYRPA